MNHIAVKEAVLVLRDLQSAVSGAHRGVFLSETELIVLLRRTIESGFMLLQDLELQMNECLTEPDTQCLEPNCKRRKYVGPN